MMHSDDLAVDHPTSGTLFRSLATLALCVHALILIIMWLLSIWPLVIINVTSVVTYSVALILNRRRLYLAVLAIGMVEVILHAVVATRILGWSSGFHIYVLCLVPLVFFFDPWSLRLRVGASLTIAVVYVGLSWYAYRNAIEYDHPIVQWFRYGNHFVAAITLSALSYYYGTAVRAAHIALQQSNRQLDRLARTYALTELPNRRAALAMIERERVQMLSAKDTFSLGIADIDHFKRVNDTFGHDGGDVVLKQLAKVMKDALRSNDHVARWGGEEFLIILPGTDRAGAATAAENLRRAVSETELNLDGKSVSLTVTIGVAEYLDGAGDDEILKQADGALYKGKEQGRNRVVVAGCKGPV